MFGNMLLKVTNNGKFSWVAGFSFIFLNFRIQEGDACFGICKFKFYNGVLLVEIT